MERPGRNDPCPCGSGKKFKKCHMGREEELLFRRNEPLPSDAGKRIAALPAVRYGRSAEMAAALDIKELTGKKKQITFIDFHAYRNLGLMGQEPPRDTRNAGVMVNPKKTEQEDPDRIYLAITPDASDSTVIHLLAHVLDYLGGSGLLPGSGYAVSMETGIPLEQLDHTQEFAQWLIYLKNRFDVELDAEDAVIAYLYEHGRLIPADQVRAGDPASLTLLSERILRFLHARRREIDERIRHLDGYQGNRRPSPSAS